MSKSITQMSIDEIFQNISKSSIDFTKDIFDKPDNENWGDYIQYSLIKDDRYAFIGLLMIGVSLFTASLSKNL
jgi:hypothetical protein